MNRIIFKKDYFSDIKKITHERVALDSQGMFEEVIKVYFTKWYKFKEVIKVDSQAQAKEIIKMLQETMDKGPNELTEILIENDNPPKN